MFRPNKYEVVRGIWKSIAVSSVIYGMDSINWTADEIKKLYIIQNEMDRLGLRANCLVGTEATQGDVGWSSFEEQLSKRKLKCKIRLEKMEELRWAKNIYQDSGIKSRWNCVRIANKYVFFPGSEWKLSLYFGDIHIYI